jgi:hypothetical protein
MLYNGRDPTKYIFDPRYSTSNRDYRLDKFFKIHVLSTTLDLILVMLLLHGLGLGALVGTIR